MMDRAQILHALDKIDIYGKELREQLLESVDVVDNPEQIEELQEQLQEMEWDLNDLERVVTKAIRRLDDIDTDELAPHHKEIIEDVFLLLAKP